MLPGTFHPRDCGGWDGQAGPPGKTGSRLLVITLPSSVSLLSALSVGQAVAGSTPPAPWPAGKFDNELD